MSYIYILETTLNYIPLKHRHPIKISNQIRHVQPYATVNKEIWLILADELAELKEKSVQIQYFGQIVDHLTWFCRTCLKSTKNNEEKQKMSTCTRFELEALGSRLVLPKISPNAHQHWQLPCWFDHVKFAYTYFDLSMPKGLNSSTLIGGKRWSRSKFASHYAWGTSGVYMWLQDGCKVYVDSYVASNGSCFMVIRSIFKNRLLEVGLTQTRETMALRTLTTVDLFCI